MRKNYCRPVYWRLWKPRNDLLDEVMEKNKNLNLNICKTYVSEN